MAILDRSLLDDMAASVSATDLERLLDRAAAELPVLNGRMVTAWRAGDLSGVAYEAHKLTGLAASFGAAHLAHAADILDRACRNAPPAPRQSDIDCVTEALEPALDAMATWRTEWRASR
ncbi:MAG: Hpt domain-containing protein [Alphaproteobacteria bacterium]|nr:Hpt domain-containing protein [Alphaproteobacteria bacterium]